MALEILPDLQRDLTSDDERNFIFYSAIPCIYIIVLLPALFIQINISDRKPIGVSKLFILKNILYSCLLLNRLLVLLIAIIDWQFFNKPIDTSNLIVSGTTFVIMVLLLFIIEKQRKAGIQASGILFNFVIVFIVSSVPQLLFVIRTYDEVSSSCENILRINFIVFLGILVILLFVSCFADANPMESQKSCPEDYVSFLSFISFTWYSPIISRSHKKTVEEDDLFDIRDDLEPQYLYEKWQKAWKTVQTKNDLKHSTKLRTNEIEPLLGEKVKIYGTPEKKDLVKEDNKPPASIMQALYIIFKWDFISCLCQKILAQVMTFGKPMFLNLLISFTEDLSAPFYLGIIYAFAMFLNELLRSLLYKIFQKNRDKIGISSKSILIQAIHEKTLKLSNKAKGERTHGQILMLMSTDAEQYRYLQPIVNQIVVIPLQLVVYSVMIYNLLGWAVVFTIITMAFLVVANYICGRLNKKWMKVQMRLKDERSKMCNEVLNGIKVIKLYAWEVAMEKAVKDIRDREVALFKKMKILQTATDMINDGASIILTVVSFALFVLSSDDHVLTPRIAFVGLTIFDMIREPLSTIVDAIEYFVQLMESNERLKRFFASEELDSDVINWNSSINQEKSRDVINVHDVSLAWVSDAILQNLSFKVTSGELLAIVGPVAAGKSSLLGGLFGEMKKLRGTIDIKGSIAYVPQQPWIRNKTVRENILMGKVFDEKFYWKVVEACALKADLHLLPNADLTEIGEKGVNLSGGQKSRIALARAVYQDRDIYLLDDPLSAVDSHVAKHIFNQVIADGGLLHGKTRLLVTHGLSFLEQSHKIAVMQHGFITHIDRYDVLVQNPEVAMVLTEVENEEVEEEVEDLELEMEIEVDDDEERDSGEHVRTDMPSPVIKRISRQSSERRYERSISKKETETEKLINKEKVQEGRVKFSVYKEYFRAMGFFNRFVPFIVFMTIYNLLTMASKKWLQTWSDDSVDELAGNHSMSVIDRLAIYTGLGFTEISVEVVAFFLLILGNVAASVKMHDPLLHNILRSPSSFFDITPIGRILNRMSKDIETIDFYLPYTMRYVAINFMLLLQTCIIVTSNTPLFLLFIVPVSIIYFIVMAYHISSHRQVQRLMSAHLSPIYSHFGESIQGASSIRGFKWVTFFNQQLQEKLKIYTNSQYLSLISTQWIALRLEFLGTLLILVTALLAVLSKHLSFMTPGAIGLSISYVLNITVAMNFFVRQLSNTEKYVVSVERVSEYSHTPTEAPWRIPEKKPPAGWPLKGKIKFIDYSTRYRPDLQLTLKNLNITFLPGEKIGVVGRTGAGKSSLALALFRIVEAAGGQILLDDVDISTIGLHDLRENLTIIPQDPVLFSGTLRFNLDPLNIYSDAELWSALDHSNLRPFVDQLPQALEHHIDESGDNISVGQRQLVCLTRALLRKSRVLVLDEATAAVDVQTDALIQTTIRKQFNQSTVVTIAHRLNTILDYDKILVMDKGRTAEFDTPNNLLNNKKSLFYAMAETAKLV